MRTCSPPRPALFRPPLCAVAVALLFLAPASAAAAPLRPSADFSVSASRPLANYGSATHLVISRSPARRAYLRFMPAAPVRQGARVTLRLYSLRDAPAGVIVRHAADRAWSEDAETFRSAPRTGPRAVLSGPLSRRRWTTIDVSRLVTGKSTVSLGIVAVGTGSALIASRESGPTAPKLLVEPPRPGGVLPAVHPVLPGQQPGGTVPPLPLPPPGARPTPDMPCGVTGTTPAWRHVVVVVFENKNYQAIIGAPEAPYFNALAARCGLATSYSALVHPSVPNYIGMTSGDTQGVTGTVSPAQQLAAPSIFSQLGDGWRVLAESMPTNCALSSASPYMATHNPAAYYSDSAAACAVQDVPLMDPPDISARFTFIVPNSCNDMHSCPVASGDTWLSQLMPKLFDTPEYRSGTTAIFVVFDEDGGGSAQRVPLIAMSPSTAAGAQDATPYSHYSLLRTSEEMLGLPLLANAATATSIRAGLGL